MNDPSKDGIVLTKKYARGEFIPTDLQWGVVEVARDFTLYDLFLLVKQADDMMPHLSATLGMTNFDEFWKQINLDREPDDDDDITHLELFWYADYDTRTTKKTGKPTDQRGIKGLGKSDTNYWDKPYVATMPNLMSFHGIGPGCPSKEYHECTKDCPDETPYAIEFTPLNNLSHLPISIVPKIEFHPPYVESDRDFKQTGFQLTIEPTLWCFITSILWELTFAGSTPNEVSDHMKEIDSRMDEAKRQLEEEENSDD